MQFNVLKTQGGEMMLTLNHGASVYQTFLTAPTARQIAAALIAAADELDGKLSPLKIRDTRFEYEGRRWEDDARRLMEALTPRPQSIDSLRVDRQHVEEIPALIEYGLIERRAKQPLLYQLTDSGRVMLAEWQLKRPTLDPLTEGLTDALQEIIEQPADTPVPPKSPFRKSFSWACDHLPTFAFRGYDFDMDDLHALRVTYLMPQTQMALEESGVNGGAVDYLVEGDWLERQQVAGFTAPFVCLTTKGEELLLVWNAAIENAMKEAGA